MTTQPTEGLKLGGRVRSWMVRHLLSLTTYAVIGLAASLTSSAPTWAFLLLAIWCVSLAGGSEDLINKLHTRASQEQPHG